MQPLGTIKITQPLGKKKKITQPLDKKNHPTTWDKKITQPLGTKKPCNLSGQKKRNLLGQKNHATSQVIKITQPLGTKQIMLSVGPIASKLVHKALN